MTAVTPTLSTEAAQAVWNHLLPQVQSTRVVTRLLVQNFPADLYGTQARPEGETFGDILWYLTSVFHVFLDGVCEGKFAELPAQPQPANAETFLAWDDAHFSLTLQKLAQLSGDQLLKPVTFAGLTQSTLDFVSSFLMNVAQHVGQLTALLSVAKKTAPTLPPAARKDPNELSDEELGTVAGGAVVSAVADRPQASAGNPHGILITAKYNQPSPIMVQTQAGLGSLLGDGGGGLGAVGSVGGIAVIAGIWGSGIASLISAGSAAAMGGTAAYSVGAALLMFASRF